MKKNKKKLNTKIENLPEDKSEDEIKHKALFANSAGQTYRWKLLMDIVTSENCKTIKNKYGLGYKAINKFMVGFITTNFYNEIMKPQQQGMLRFFDFVYITKQGNWNKPISNCSRIVDDLNTIYKWGGANG
ncbi:MAG: hypothetical protein ACE5KE_03125 [Methanosarcinales archaeon]